APAWPASVVDPPALESLLAFPRQLFGPPAAADSAYPDPPLPIEEGPTTSPPYVVALMAAALKLTSRDRVLEIGAGSGYAAAVLSRIAAEVYAIERHAALAELASRRMKDLGVDNADVRHGAGNLRRPGHAPHGAH